ncbi:MAG: hypothetical protein M0Q53_07630 [Prolixibacteraceae bacterium]|nr:hypothetical protein [Prolixibacteraceae bacterium]
MSGNHKFFELSESVSGGISYRKFLIIYLCLFFGPHLLSGQTIKDFKEILVIESREFLHNNQKPLPYLQSGFHYFSHQQDNGFTEMLEHAWEKFSPIPGIHVPRSRKFDPAPKFSFEETSYHNSQSLPCIIIDQKDEESATISENLPRIRKPEYTTTNLLRQNFKFYGNTISFTYDRLLALSVNHQINSEIIVDFWKEFLVGNSEQLIGQLTAIKDRLGLNDWGYFLLVKDCSKSLYPNDEPGATLLSWALMIRSGFDVKIGYNQLGASVLYRTSSNIYGIPSVRIDDFDYYIDKSIATLPVTSYSSNHAEATGCIRLNINRSLNFQGEIAVKKIQFLWNQKLHGFNLRYNPEVTKFLEEYPQTDPEICFNAPFTFLSKESLLKQFKPVLAEMKKEEGAAFLQQFVQKSFAYRPYNDLFGYDRFMFPEELLFRDESNDKGKSLLFAWLISNLMNQKAVLVEFPGFYSVAISLNQPLDGDNFQVKGVSYTMADPTFDNAPLGLVMKDFYPLRPLIKLLHKASDEFNEQDKIWKLALSFGAERCGAGRDYLKDESGNSFITGFLTEKTNKQPSSVQVPFIAKFDENNKLIWMDKFHSDMKAFGLELKQLDKNEFYLAGSFRGKLEYNGIMQQTAPSDPDLFFAQFNGQGDIEWISKSGIDELEEDTKLFYTVNFARSGDIQEVRLANEDERSGTIGFRKGTNEGLCYVGSRFQSTGLEKATEEVKPKAITSFRHLVGQMKLLGIEPNTAYISAILNSVNKVGNQLTTSDFASLNLQLSDKNGGSVPMLTETLQKIKNITNSNGIIELSTVNSIPIKIAPFRISSRSHLKIIHLDNNDLKLKVIDGIEYESGWIKEFVNSIIIELSTGNLVIDLGSEHQIISKNIKHDILK